MERMNKMLQMGAVGLDILALKKVVQANIAELETKSVPVPGELEKEGVKIIKTMNIDPTQGLTIVSGFEVGGERYSVYYTKPD